MMAQNYFLGSFARLITGGLIIAQSVVTPLSPATANALCQQLSSYMVTSNGKCVDLTYVNGGRPKLFPIYETKISQFENALSAIGIPITYQQCKEPGLLGMYNSASNRMIICELTQAVSQREIYETLVHESWHTVQDCISGLNNTNTLALSQAYPEFRQEVLGGISLSDFAIMDAAYSKQQHLTESEARFMQDKPELVLAWLGRCQGY